MKLSIIVPAYNAASWLSGCVASLMAQELADYEVIVINDGSTDSTRETLQQLSLRYGDRLIAVNKENEGVSATRNRGIEMAHGNWIMFVDSDDEVETHSLGNIISEVERIDGCDWAFLGVEIINGQTVSPNLYPVNVEIHTPASLSAQTLDSNFSSPCAKLYRKEIIIGNNIRFDRSLKMYEDAIFNMEYLRHATKCATIPGKFYKYIVRNGSSSRKYHGNHLFAVIERLRKLRYDYFIRDKGMTELTDRINRDAAFVYLFAIYSIYRAKGVSDKYAKLKEHWATATDADPRWSYYLDSGLPKIFAQIARRSLFFAHLFLSGVFMIEKIK